MPREEEPYCNQFSKQELDRAFPLTAPDADLFYRTTYLEVPIKEERSAIQFRVIHPNEDEVAA